MRRLNARFYVALVANMIQTMNREPERIGKAHAMREPELHNPMPGFSVALSPAHLHDPVTRIVLFPLPYPARAFVPAILERAVRLEPRAKARILKGHGAPAQAWHVARRAPAVARP